MTRRVVITGLGVVSPIGIGKQNYWDSLVSGKSGITQISKFPLEGFASKIAGEIKNFNPEDYGFSRKDIRRMDLISIFAVIAANEAMEDANIVIKDPYRAGVMVSSGIGGINTFEIQHSKLIERGPTRVSPFFIPMMIQNTTPGEISIRFNLKGPNFSIVSACASSTHAIGESFETIRRNDADLMVTGGAEAAISEMAVAGFSSMRALSTRNDEPEKASRPFDKERDGFVIAEGSGVIILEELEHAIKRDAKIYAEITGYGATADAYHITAPCTSGLGSAKAMEFALNKAGISINDIDYINAHGTSTPLNDKIETIAIKTLFKEHAYKLAVNSTKSMTGHLLGAAGGVEAIATVLQIQNKTLHPTINYTTKDPECDLDYVPNKARNFEIKNAISNSLGFGGHNASIVISKYE
jgi:3-oxoacyl-[acyl-carrier-protein] synthase II